LWKEDENKNYSFIPLSPFLSPLPSLSQTPRKQKNKVTENEKNNGISL